MIRKVHRTTVSTTTKILKQVFSEYGVPQTVMTDNGPPFSSKEFAAFPNQYHFDHIMSSPCYLQSNGFVECMVQTVRQSMRKRAAGVHDPTLAMLIYRATPLISITCRAIRRMNTALVPTRSPIQNPYCQVIWEQMVKDEDKLYEHHNKTARDLPSVPQNQRVQKFIPSLTNGLQQPLPKCQ